MPSPANNSLISSLYLAYFGRPADPVGLQYYGDALENAQELGTDILPSLMDAFANSPEAQARFQGLTTEQFVKKVYQTLFNRPAEPDGLLYWSQAIDSQQISLGKAVLAILQGAQDGNAQDLSLVNLRNGVSLQFTQSLGTTAYNGNAAADVATLLTAGITLNSTAQQINDLLQAARQLVQLASEQPATYNALMGQGNTALELLGTTGGNNNPLAVMNLLSSILGAAVKEAGPGGSPVPQVNKVLGKYSALEDVLNNLPSSTNIREVTDAVNSGGLNSGGVEAGTVDAQEPPPPPPTTFTVAIDAGALTFGGTATGDIGVSLASDGTATFTRSGVTAALQPNLVDITTASGQTLKLSANANDVSVATAQKLATLVTANVVALNSKTATLLDAADQLVTSTVTFATAHKLSADALDLAVSDAQALLGLTGFDANGYALTINDTILAADGKNFTTGFSGNTGVTLSASDGDQTVTGSASNDQIDGGKGADVITGGDGADALIGGDGDDTFYFTDNLQVRDDSSVVGGSGFDTIAFTMAIDTLTTGSAQGDNFHADFGNASGIERIQLAGASSVNLGDVFPGVGITTIAIGDDNTTLRYDNQLLGTLTVDATALADDKTLTLSPNAAPWGGRLFTVTGLKGNVDASALEDSIAVTAATGAGFSVSITGGNSDDALTGSAGGDVITGGGGADRMLGGAGNDVFVMSADTPGGERINGGSVAGSEVNSIRLDATADLTNLLATNVDGTLDTAYRLLDDGAVNQVVLNGNSANATFQGTLLTGQAINFAKVNVADTSDVVINVSASTTGDFSALTFQDDFRGSGFVGLAAGDNAITFHVVGGAAEVTIVGTSLSDVINGGDGDDTLTGGAGADTLLGGDGNDKFRYLQSNDLFPSTSLADTIDGGAGTNTLVIGDNVGTQNSFQIVDTMGWTGMSNVSRIEVVGPFLAQFNLAFSDDAYESGLRVVDLSADTDGDNNANFINVSAETGAANGFTLIGSAGVDYITGGAGADIVDGGAGNDIYVVGGVSQLIGRGMDNAGAVAVKDVNDFIAFTAGDKIDLSAFDTELFMGGVQPFSFFGTENAIRAVGSFSLGVFAGSYDAVTGLFTDDANNGGTANNAVLVVIDMTVDGSFDHAIVITGVTNLVASDFVGVSEVI